MPNQLLRGGYPVGEIVVPSSPRYGEYVCQGWPPRSGRVRHFAGTDAAYAGDGSGTPLLPGVAYVPDGGNTTARRGTMTLRTGETLLPGGV